MRSLVIALLLFISLATSASLSAQQPASPPGSAPSGSLQTTPPLTAQRDPRAIQILTQVLSVAGGIAAVTAVQDYTGTGTITYNWAGDQVPGTVTVMGRGTAQFRLDATLSNGVRTWAVSGGNGFISEINGTTHMIVSHNTFNLGSLTLPLTYLCFALNNTSTSIAYIGLETINGEQVQHIQTQTIFGPSVDPLGMLWALSKRDFFIDASTFYVASTLDMNHPDNSWAVNYPHVMQYSNYRSVSGILVPFAISETNSGQTSYTIQLSQVSFNSGLQDSNFEQ
jgi:hypothetical protein